jgi:hypothetical protein
MCKIMGASRGVPDYYEMLGLGYEDATQPMIKKVLRANNNAGCVCCGTQR